MKRIITILILTSVIFMAVPTVMAQGPTVDDVKAKFGSLTQAEIEAMGYTVQPVCVDAGEVPAPVREQFGLPATAAMGIHAVNEALFDNQVNPLEPEDILLGPDGQVWGVEYEATADTADPTVFGQPMPLLEGGHPGMEFNHYALHLWFVDNPAGMFADFNPALSCAPAALPATGGAQPAAGVHGSWLLVAAGLLLLVAGLGVIAGQRAHKI